MVQFALVSDQHSPETSNFNTKPDIICSIKSRSSWFSALNFYLMVKKKERMAVINEFCSFAVDNLRNIYIYSRQLSFYTLEKLMGNFILHFYITTALHMKRYADLK